MRRSERPVKPRPAEHKKVTPVRPQSYTRWLWAAAAVFFIQSYGASQATSPMWDEPFHIAAGMSYLETHQIVVNQQHPPLLKELSAVFLRAAGVPWPSWAPEVHEMLSSDAANMTGVHIIMDNGVDRVLFWSRLPFLLLGTGFVFVLYGLGRRLVGPAAALGGVFFYAFDPTILAHSGFVASDTGLMFFQGLFLIALWDYFSKPGKMRLVFCGLALGALLGSKFSAVALLPVTVLLTAAAALWPAAITPEAPSRRIIRYGMALAVMCGIAFLTLEALYFFTPHPLQYVDGMRRVNTDHNPNYLYYLAGRFAKRFYSYYAAAYLLKEPLAAILAAVVGLGVLLRNRAIPGLAFVFLLIPPAILLAGYTLLSDDIGVRYMIPVFPFLYLAGGAGLAALFQSKHTWQKSLAWTLCVWLVIAAAGIYPDYLPYFNEAACMLDDPAKLGLAGGTACGPAWLDDSNVDIGDELKQLKTWLDTKAHGRPVRIAYFGLFPPLAYGVKVGPRDYPDTLSGMKPGLYAVSAHVLARARSGPEMGAWLLRARPVAVVAHTYYIYDLPEGTPEITAVH